MVEASTNPTQTAAASTADVFNFDTHTFKTPEKTLVTVEHVEEFKSSPGCAEIIGFIAALQNGCKTSQMTTTPLTEVSLFLMCRYAHVHS